MTTRLTDDEIRAMLSKPAPGSMLDMPLRASQVFDLAREVLELRAEVATHRQRELAEAMSNISEDYYCAGWLIGLEFRLWAMVQGGSRDFGLGAVSEDEVAELRRLSERCGGWMIYGDGGPEFMPMADWLKHYEAKKGRP